MKGFLILLFSLSSVSFAANRLANDPRFTYPAAGGAFQTATVPIVSDLVGTWTLIGIAAHPAVAKDSGAGYWPDGRYELEGASGYYKTAWQVTETVDTFGNTVLSNTYSTIGAETGKVYSTVGPYSGVLNSEGYVYDQEASASRCASSIICRLSKDTLLCQYRIDDRTSGCRKFPRDVPSGYMGFRRL